MTLEIRPAIPTDDPAIRDVIRQTFNGNDEVRLVDELRAGGYARVSLVAEIDNQLVGHIILSLLPIVTPVRTIEALSLAPLAVIPSHQRRGIGKALVREGLLASRSSGYEIVIVLGHPDYYPKFGFSAQLAERLESPYSGPAFMALELVSGALGVEGEVRYPPPFSAF